MFKRDHANILPQEIPEEGGEEGYTIYLSFVAAAMFALVLITRDWTSGLGYMEIGFLTGLAVLCLDPIVQNIGDELVKKEIEKNRILKNSDTHIKRESRGRLSLTAVGLIAFVLVARGWSLDGLGYLEIGLIFVLALICVTPMFQWCTGGMGWLPIGEIYVAMHLIYYVLPCLAGRKDWLVYEESHRIKVLLAVGVFLIAFLIAYKYFLRGSGSRLRRVTLLYREISWGAMWTFFALWVSWSVLLQGMLIPELGWMFQIFRVALRAAGSLSVVFLFYQWGQRRCPPSQCFILMSGFLIALGVNFASGLLAGTVEFLGAALLAFSMGRKEVPIRAVTISMMAVAMLHLGKYEYRNTYWVKGKNWSDQRIGLVSGYEAWYNSARKHLLEEDQQDKQKTEILGRTSLVQILGFIMNATPEKQPFINGQTYFLLPELALPRVFNPEKARGTLPTETLGIYYGLQTVQGANHTSISIGVASEAWANFGWLGLLGAGTFFGMLFGVPAMLTRQLAPNQVGWLLASIFLIYSILPECALVELVIWLGTTLLMGAIGLIIISHKVHIQPSVGRETRSQLPSINAVNTRHRLVD